jgi:hypothetical protein
MLMLSMMLDEDDDDMLLLLYRRHLSIVHNNNFFFILDSMFMNIEPEDRIPRLLPANLNRTFDLLNDEWCYHHTRFNVSQLREQYLHLDLPVSLNISTRGHKASSEEAFIITLTKLATGRTNTGLVEIFGATTVTFISRVYKTTIHLLDNKAEGILHGNCLQRWVHLFPDFAEVIRRKLYRPQYGALLFEDVRIVGFLDCKIDETCTPGTGPMNDEELAERRPGAEIIQRALYSGYLKNHGLKVLTVVFPNGIIAYLYGPVSARENDIGLLNLSWLNEHLVALQPEITAARANGDNLLYFSLYGDKIFPYLQCVTHAHEPPLGGQLQPKQMLEVLAMNSLRTSVEWPYGDVVVLFSIMQHKHQKKYFLPTGLVNMTLHKQFCVIFFLYNCYVCFNGNKFTKFFDLPPPSLADYLDV